MYFYIFVISTLLSIYSSAQNRCDFKSIADFHKQLETVGPALDVAAKKKEFVESSKELAKQRPNPLLDFESLKGNQFGIAVNTYTLSAKHIIEFGSKRDKRISRANSFINLNSRQVDYEFFRQNLSNTISFQKLAQLDLTIKSVEEAIFTFSKIIKKLSIRKRLNPEETVSLSTLELAANEYKAQLNDLVNERNLLEGEVAFYASCKEIKPVYSFMSFSFLKFKESSDKEGLIKLERLKVDMAKSDFDIEKSKGYSNIEIGPVLEYQSQGRDEFLSGGVAISFALPLFQTNDGGKLQAAKALAKQKRQSENSIELLKIKRQRLVQKYNRSLNVYNKMPSLKSLDSRHKKVERLFSRGLVSISMTIESHRQLINFLKSRFETQNDLLDTYGKISLIDGDVKSFKLLLNKGK